MSAQNRTEKSAGQPADLENKSLAPADIENKAAAEKPAKPTDAASSEATDDGKVSFKLSTHFTHEGEDLPPGEKIRVSRDRARSLTRSGFGAVVDD